jgi:tol-pal system protein YbgF
MRLIYSTALISLLLTSSVLAEEIHSAFDAADAEKRFDRIESAIDSMQKQINTLIVNNNPSAGLKGDDAKSASSTFTQLEDIRQQIKSIRGDVEQVQFDNARLNEKMVKFAADTEYRFNEISKNIQKNPADDASKLADIDEQLDSNVIQKESDSRPKVDKSSASSKQQSAADKAKAQESAKQTIEDKYNEAYSYLKSKDYKMARDLFQKFVNDNPDNDLTGSAFYWLGETYFQRGEFDKAATQYLKGYQSNVRGSRSPDNLLKLSKSLAKLDKRKEACISLSKLKKEFPNASSGVKKQMQDDIKELRCAS